MMLATAKKYGVAEHVWLSELLCSSLDSGDWAMKSRAFTALFLAVCLMGLIASARGATKEDWVEECNYRAEAAKSIMANRQYGAPMAEIMEAVQGNELLERYVVIAYSMPRYATEKVQKETITEFQNIVYGECYKHVLK